MKQIVSYETGGPIKVHAVACTPEEHREARRQLDEMNAEILFIDADSVYAEITGGTYETLLELEKLGWSFYDETE